MIGPAWLGLDPGVGGAIAALDLSGHPLGTWKMPETEQDMLEIFRAFAPGTCAILERVHSSPQMGVRSAFTFGMGYGGLRMALAAAAIPFDEVSPIKWQKFLNCQTGGDKHVSKQRAQDLFPTVKVTNYLADALLLAEYGRRVSLGMRSEFTGVEKPRTFPNRMKPTRAPSLFGEQP